VRLAAFWASKINRTFRHSLGLNCGHLLGVTLRHFFEKACESLTASLTRKLRARSLVIGGKVPFPITLCCLDGHFACFEPETILRDCASRLERDVDGNGNSRMLPIVHIISVIDVVHIDIVGPVPDRRPGFRAGINHAKPEASVLEARGTVDYEDGYIVDAKPVATTKMRPEAIVRNAVSVVAAAFVPGVMLTLPIVRPLPLPDVLPFIAWSRLRPSHLAQLAAGSMPAVVIASLD